MDEDGVLILSTFTGAAQELKDALLINPFSIEEGAEALRAALQMHPEERRRRMLRMREAVEQNNVYRWTGKFISELVKLKSTRQQNQRSYQVPAPAVTVSRHRFGVAV